MTGWPIRIFQIVRVCVICLFYLFFRVCPSSFMHQLDALRGEHKSSLGLLIKRAAIGICRAGSRWMLFKSRDESISMFHTKSKELSIVDTRNKEQRLKKQKAKISDECRNAYKNFCFRCDVFDALIVCVLSRYCSTKILHFFAKLT